MGQWTLNKSDAGDGGGSGDEAENDGRRSCASPEAAGHMLYMYQAPSLRDTNIEAQRNECWVALSLVQTLRRHALATNLYCLSGAASGGG